MDRLIVTRSRLMHDLRQLGLSAGDAVMLHAAVSKIGWVVGGPDVVIRALCDVLTEAGTLMMYASWQDGPYTMQGWSEEKRQAYLAECPPFDPATSRANRAWSILTEYLRTWPGAQRSANPEWSMAAVGAQARWLTADHPMHYGSGPGSPLDKLCRINGKVLLLGCPLSEVTMLHYAENLAALPDKPIVRYHQPILRDGQTVWIDVEELDSNANMGPWERDGDSFTCLMQDYLAAGGGTAGKVGAADAYLFDAAALTWFAVQWLEATFA